MGVLRNDRPRLTIKTMERTTYCVRRERRSGSSMIIARGIDTLAEAAEVAFRLAKIQEQELGGDDDFVAEAE